MSDRLRTIQFLRAFAAVFVVLFHIKAVNYKYFHNLALPDIFSLGKCGVDLFFVISGFIMIHVTKNIKPSADSSLDFIKKRFIRIYPVYWFYSFLVLIVFFVHPTIVNSSQGGEIDIVSSFLLLPQIHLPLLMVGWTLTYEIYFYILLAVAIPFISWSNYKYYFSVIIILILMSFFIDIKNTYISFALNPLIIEFILGAYCAYLSNYLLLKSSNFLLKSIYISIVMLLLLITLYGLTKPDISTNISRVFIFGIPSVFCVFILTSLESLGYIKNIKLFSFLEKIGDSSYSLYLSHILILNAFCLIWNKFFQSCYLLDLLEVFMVAILMIMYGYVSYCFLERRLTRCISIFFNRWQNSKAINYQLEKDESS